jgi:serine/threonine-protein kinase
MFALAADAAPNLAADPRADQQLATKATAVLRKYCYRCHGEEFKVPEYNVLDREGLTKRRGEQGDRYVYVAPGNPDNSRLWDKISRDEPESGGDRMPPSGPKPSTSEIDTVKEWIKAGAPFPLDIARKPVSDQEVLKAVVDHLRSFDDRAERKRWRYFTLATLHNNPKVREDQLNLARAAISKLLNSLSRRGTIVVPTAIGPDQTVLGVDITRLGWHERSDWGRILTLYPYGLTYHNRPAGDALRKLADELDELVGDDVGLIHIRADWFADAASRPPLYHMLLDLPATAAELERRLGVDVERDFREADGRLRRAGLDKSGVSSQNRLLDRYDADAQAQGAYYWKSFDFRANAEKGNIFRFPLGPVFAANPFRNAAFQHAGGELIFSLPNGLQGYLLVDAKGNRIDAGPADIVGDDLKTSGTSLIVTGLSCMSCHRSGMIAFQDRLHSGVGDAVGGEARDKLDRLTAIQTEWNRILQSDAARFLKAAEDATGVFLNVGNDRAKPVRDFAEPVAALARTYQKDLDLATLAAELSTDEKTLKTIIQANNALQRLGLAVVLDGGTIKRAEWDSLKDTTFSIFQKASRELARGVPYREFGSKGP